MRNVRSRPLLGRTLLLGVLGLATACGGDREEPGAAAEGGEREVERGGTAILAELHDMDKPLSIVYEQVIDADLLDVMHMSLTRGAWRDGELAQLTAEESPMALARGYALVGPDSAALRYRLRSDVRWSDGRPVTAHDVVWTYRMVQNPAVTSPRVDQVALLDSVAAQNDSTVTFYFQRRYPDMLFDTSLPIAPSHLFEGTDPAQIRTHPALANPAGNLVVNGPFRIGEWSKGERIVLVPNPHFRPRPNLDRIVIRIIPETTTRLVELQTGGVDFMRPVPHDQVAGLKAQAPHVRFEREEKRYYDYVGYNAEGFAPFADPQVRLSLGLALDVPGMIRGMQMEEYAVPAGGPYSPIFRELYDSRQQAPLTHDAARARQILESRGWRDADGDGVLEKDGKPFRFTLLINAGNPRKADAAQIIQQQWKRIGVDARIQQMEFNTFWQRQQEGDYQAAIGNWGVGLSPDISVIWASGVPLNFVGYDNPRVDSLMALAKAQPTEEQANAYWKEAARLIVRDQPYTWLYYFDQVDGVNERLRGMKIDTYGAYQNAWEWWIPRARQRAQRGAPAAPTDTAPADTAAGR